MICNYEIIWIKKKYQHLICLKKYYLQKLKPKYLTIIFLFNILKMGFLMILNTNKVKNKKNKNINIIYKYYFGIIWYEYYNVLYKVLLLNQSQGWLHKRLVVIYKVSNIPITLYINMNAVWTLNNIIDSINYWLPDLWTKYRIVVL